MFTQKKTVSFIKAAALGVAVASITACGIDAPKLEIAVAEKAIETARDSGAKEYAGAELERSKGKLREAKVAVKDGENEKALRLANESIATADLAQAKAGAGKAKTAESQMQESVDDSKSRLQ